MERVVAPGLSIVASPETTQSDAAVAVRAKRFGRPKWSLYEFVTAETSSASRQVAARPPLVADEQRLPFASCV
jgi:hypothetical protein